MTAAHADTVARHVPRERRPVRHVAAVALLLAATGVPIAIRAQVAGVSPRPDEWRAWASLAAGLGSADRRGRTAGIIALWATRGPLAASVRYAGTSRLGEPGDMGDVAVLVGTHPIRESHIDGVIGFGAGRSSGRDALGDLPRKPAIALGGQLIANYGIVGVGLDAFAGLWSSRHYNGVGLAIAIGGFQ